MLTDVNSGTSGHLHTTQGQPRAVHATSGRHHVKRHSIHSAGGDHMEIQHHELEHNEHFMHGKHLRNNKGTKL